MENQDNIIFLKDLKWKKTCSICNKEIPMHSQAWWWKEEKKYAHIECYKKDNIKKLANTNSSTNKEGQYQRPSNPNPNKVTPVPNGAALYDKMVGQIVSDRMKKAKALVDEEFPSAKEYADYTSLIVECMHQLFSEEMAIKIQASKEKNIGMLK